MTFPPFGRVQSVAAAATVLGCDVADLNEIADATDQARYYTRFDIPKKGRRRAGQFRTVFRPEQRLGLIQKNVNSWLSEHVSFPEYVQGFVQKRSIVSNARTHLGQKTLLHADIENFFDSISFEQVLEAFQTLGFREPVGGTLARVCTLNSRLPQGSSASPIIANSVCRHMDTDLNTLAAATRSKFSRYADDITLSGDEVPDEKQVKTVLNRYGFSLREDRCRTQRRGKSQYVTGLTISDPASPRVGRKLKRRLRLELHYAGRYGIEGHIDRVGSAESARRTFARLHGWMGFLYAVEGKRQRKMYEQWLKVQVTFSPDRPDLEDSIDGHEH